MITYSGYIIPISINEYQQTYSKKLRETQNNYNIQDLNYNFTILNKEATVPSMMIFPKDLSNSKTPIIDMKISIEYFTVVNKDFIDNDGFFSNNVIYMMKQIIDNYLIYLNSLENNNIMEGEKSMNKELEDYEYKVEELLEDAKYNLTPEDYDQFINKIESLLED